MDKVQLSPREQRALEAAVEEVSWPYSDFRQVAIRAIEAYLQQCRYPVPPRDFGLKTIREAADALAAAVERATGPGRTRTHALKSLPAALARYRQETGN